MIILHYNLQISSSKKNDQMKNIKEQVTTKICWSNKPTILLSCSLISSYHAVVLFYGSAGAWIHLLQLAFSQTGLHHCHWVLIPVHYPLYLYPCTILDDLKKHTWIRRKGFPVSNWIQATNLLPNVQLHTFFGHSHKVNDMCSLTFWNWLMAHLILD